MNELQLTKRNTLLYKNLSLSLSLSQFILESVTQFVVSLWDRWRDIYSKRGLLLAPYLLPGARGCQRLHTLTSRIVRDDLTSLIGYVSLARLSILTGLTVSSWPRGSHITWSPSGYTPARPAYPDELPSSCLLITTWQLVKAHGVTRNKP